MRAIAVALSLALATSAPSRAGDTWPGWRGPTGMGHTDEKGLPLTWGGPAGENVLWKSPLPGTGAGGKADHNQSSPIVWKGRVFVTAAWWPDGVAQTEYPEHRVACYAAADGKLLWDVKVPPGPWRLKDLRSGYAAPTPCTDGRRVYALFGSSELVALDFEGVLLWRKEVAPFAWDVAIGTSPVLTRDAVVVLADSTDPALSRLIAYDPATGDVKWERKRPEANFNHTTPLLIEAGGVPQLVVAASGAVQGIDPAGGAVLWWARNKGDVPTPAYGGGLVFAEGGRGGPAVAVDPTGRGDVTKTHVRWVTRPTPEGYSSPTIFDGRVYRAHEPGVLRCYALATGAKAFDERLPAGVNISASPVVTPDGRLYFAGGGKSVVLQAGAGYEPLGAGDLGDGSAASPAVAAGRLYLKGKKFLYCIADLGKKP
jgi:outer membrane protein assembly factor BamB